MESLFAKRSWFPSLLRDLNVVGMAERKANEDEIPECADGPTTVVSFFAREIEVLTIPFFDLETLSLQKSKSKHEALGGMVELWRMEFMRLTMMRTSTWAHNMKQLKVIRCLWWDKKGQFAEIEIDGEKFTENSSLKKLREGGALCEDGDFTGGQSRMWRKWRSKRVRPRGRRCGSGG